MKYGLDELRSASAGQEARVTDDERSSNMGKPSVARMVSILGRLLRASDDQVLDRHFRGDQLQP